MLTEIWEETGQKPAALANRPTLASKWDFPHRVWSELSGSRNYTPGGVAEIPFSEFYMWATAHEYTKSEMQSMWEDLHVFDSIWVSENRKRSQKDAEDKQSKQKSTNSASKVRM